MGGGGEKTFSQLNSADEQTANIHHCVSSRVQLRMRKPI